MYGKNKETREIDIDIFDSRADTLKEKKQK